MKLAEARLRVRKSGPTGCEPILPSSLQSRSRLPGSPNARDEGALEARPTATPPRLFCSDSNLRKESGSLICMPVLMRAVQTVLRVGAAINQTTSRNGRPRLPGLPPPSAGWQRLAAFWQKNQAILVYNH